MSRRTTIPTDFRGFDDDVYRTGAPASSWLGTSLAQAGRWCGAHLRRASQRMWAMGQTDPLPLVTGPRSTLPLSHYGTPGCGQLGGEIYLAAKLASGSTATVLPYVCSPPLLPARLPIPGGTQGEATITGTGAVALYGPYRCPLAEGPCRVGLVISPRPNSGGKADTGDVYLARGNTMAAVDPDFEDLADPAMRGKMPLLRILNADGDQISALAQVVTTGQTFQANDTLFTTSDLLPPGQVVTVEDACTYELWPYAEIGAVELYAIAVYELAVEPTP